MRAAPCRLVEDDPGCNEGPGSRELTGPRPVLSLPSTTAETPVNRSRDSGRQQAAEPLGAHRGQVHRGADAGPGRLDADAAGFGHLDAEPDLLVVVRVLGG